MDLVLLFPGQGSQKPGMGKDLAEAFPDARRVFDEVDSVLGVQLSRVCFEGPADELTATRNAQPALLAHAAAAWSVAKQVLRGRVCAAAGHSLGEHTAYHAAGATTLSDAARLVRRRGELMYEAGLKRPGAMAAILGQLDRSIDSLCEQASRDAGLVVPANYNAADQTVVSGEVRGVEHVMKLARDAGAKRALRLPVSGAFHSPLMQPAADGFAEALAETEFREPDFPVYSNVSEQPCSSAAEARDLLARQLTSPVRWVGEMKNITAKHPDAVYVELGPGSVLTGLLARIAPGVRSMSCGGPRDMEKLAGELAL